MSKPYIGEKLKKFIQEVEKLSKEKIKFEDCSNQPDSDKMSRTFSDTEKGIIYCENNIDYSNELGQYKIAHEVTHVHFHKNLDFINLKLREGIDDFKKRLIESVGSLAEDALVFEFLEEKSFGSNEKQYKNDFLANLKTYEKRSLSFKRVDPENQEIMKKLAFIYGLFFSRSKRDKRKTNKAFSKHFSHEEKIRLEKLINECSTIILKSSDTKANKYLKIYKLLLKKLNLAHLVVDV